MKDSVRKEAAVHRPKTISDAERKERVPFSDVRPVHKQQTKSALWHAIPKASRKKVLAPKKQDTNDSHPGLDRLLLVATLLFAFCIGVGSYTLLGSPNYEQQRSSVAQAIMSAPPPVPAAPPRKETSGPIVLDATKVPPATLMEELAFIEGNTYLYMGHEREIKLMGKKGVQGDEFGAGEFLRTFAPQAPDSLLRAIGPDTYHFLIRQEERLDGILTFSVSSYPYAAGGMRIWERSLTGELLPLLAPWRSKSDVAIMGERPFIDMRLGELDTRAIVDKNGKVAFIYAFPSRETLIFASSASALLAYATSSASN